jgi:hypothetical protein
MSSFYITPNESALDVVTEQMAKDPVYADRYEAIKEVREIDKGQLYRGTEFRRVASLQGPLSTLGQVLDPDWLQNKRRFYAWLDAHPQHCTYDRRRQPLGDGLFHGFGEGTLGA